LKNNTNHMPLCTQNFECSQSKILGEKSKR